MLYTINMIKDNTGSSKIFNYLLGITTVNQILIPLLDRDYIEPAKFMTYTYLQVFYVAVFAALFLIQKKIGYRDSLLYTYMTTILSYGVIGQYFLPSAYITYILALFCCALVTQVTPKIFSVFTIGFFLLTSYAIFDSGSNYSNEPLMAEKFKMDAIQSLLIMAGFITFAQYMRDKERKKRIAIEQKLMSLGNQSAMIVHDLKGQLLAPLNYVSMLESDKSNLNETNQEVLSELKSSLGDIKKYVIEVNQIFAFKKESAELNLQECVSKVQEVYKSKLNGIQVEVSQDKLISVQDIGMFKSVLVNMFLNSSEQFESKGTIGRKVEVSLKDFVLTFKDNSGGFDHQVLKQVNNHEYSSTKKFGSGYGLYFMQTYASEVGANFKIYNESDKSVIQIDFSKGKVYDKIA